MSSNVAGQIDPDLGQLKASALRLLLRSPRLSVSVILELLDIGDAEFRQLCCETPAIAELLTARREGTLQSEEAEPRCCSACGIWFLPYAGAKQCSDECRQIVRLQYASRK
jgi:hypothetical protein